MKNSSAIFQAGDARRRVKHAVIDYEIQIMAANRGLSQRISAVTLEKWFYHFSSYLIINGRTMIERSILSMLNGGVEHIIVVLGCRRAEVEAVLRKTPFFDHLQIVYNQSYYCSEMLDSIKLGVQALDRRGCFFLLPGDIPAVNPDTFRTVYAAHVRSGKAVTFPSVNGFRKHPPLISPACIDTILSFSEDGGLRGLWRYMEASTGQVPVDDLGCTMDVDYPQDYMQVLRYLRDVRAV